MRIVILSMLRLKRKVPWTRLLEATNMEIQELGWWLLPLVLLASMLMLASALVFNNGMGR
jgi:CBS-domain-containing membrane protein